MNMPFDQSRQLRAKVFDGAAPVNTKKALRGASSSIGDEFDFYDGLSYDKSVSPRQAREAITGGAGPKPQLGYDPQTKVRQADALRVDGQQNFFKERAEKMAAEARATEARKMVSGTNGPIQIGYDPSTNGRLKAAADATANAEEQRMYKARAKQMYADAKTAAEIEANKFSAKAKAGFDRLRGGVNNLAENYDKAFQRTGKDFTPNAAPEGAGMLGKGANLAKNAGGRAVNALGNMSTKLINGGGKSIPYVGPALSAMETYDVIADPNATDDDKINAGLEGTGKAAAAAATAKLVGGAGAALGTLVAPGVGTTVGATLGALGGGALGYFGGEEAVRWTKSKLGMGSELTTEKLDRLRKNAAAPTAQPTPAPTPALVQQSQKAAPNLRDPFAEQNAAMIAKANQTNPDLRGSIDRMSEFREGSAKAAANGQVFMGEGGTMSREEFNKINAPGELGQTRNYDRMGNLLDESREMVYTGPKMGWQERMSAKGKEAQLLRDQAYRDEEERRRAHYAEFGGENRQALRRIEEMKQADYMSGLRERAERGDRKAAKRYEALFKTQAEADATKETRRSSLRGQEIAAKKLQLDEIRAEQTANRDYNTRMATLRNDERKTENDRIANELANKNDARKEFENMFVDAEGKRDEQLEAIAYDQANAASGGKFAALSSAERAMYAPDAKSYARLVQGAQSRQNSGIMQHFGITGADPRLGGLPDKESLRKTIMEKVGFWDGLTTPKVSWGDYRLKGGRSTPLYLPADTQENDLAYLERMGVTMPRKQ